MGNLRELLIVWGAFKYNTCLKMLKEDRAGISWRLALFACLVQFSRNPGVTILALKADQPTSYPVPTLQNFWWPLLICPKTVLLP